ncbi:alpha/beta hydrolase [Salinisphaera sp. USBA-960]|uniref:alpha/beta hydrolase n=1 Tax=Salinisphaera orenii TaxID=856731 RepID=UPI0013A6287A|nr:alpha/beta hydrolase [Salifodinibacter halophilus]NNC27260.1 alpha/beta hydrolase [Salifodinibacter halophilus]
MTLTSEVQSVVDYLDSAEIAFTDLSVADARAFYVEMLAHSGGQPLAMAQVEDSQLPLTDAGLGVRRYRPQELVESPAPTIVYYHGGGWVLGGLDSHDRICRQLAARSGLQLIAVDYRLAPEWPLPTASDDAIAAFEWLQAHAATYDIDTSRMAVAGDSAGGHLSAVVALAARDNGWPLAFQALVYPVTDMRDAAWSHPSRLRNATIPPLTAELMDWFGRQAVGDRTDTAEWRVSPLLATSLEHAAPGLVATAGADMLMDDGGLFALRLRDAGVTCEHAHFPGVIHGSLEMIAWLEVTVTMLDRVSGSIRAALLAGES